MCILIHSHDNYDWLTILINMNKILKNMESEQTLDCDWMIQYLTINCSKYQIHPLRLSLAKPLFTFFLLLIKLKIHNICTGEHSHRKTQIDLTHPTELTKLNTKLNCI